MKITIEGARIAAAMKGAASIVEARNTIPILAMVKIAGKEGEIALTTTNLDIEYRQVLAADVDGDVEFCIDAKRFAQMSSAAPSGKDIVIEYDAKTKAVVVKSGRSRWTLPTLPAADFPSIPVEKMGSPVAIDAEAMADTIRRTLWATSHEEVRYYLNGIFWNAEMVPAKGKKPATTHVRAVCTDGLKLGMVEMSDVAWPDGSPDIIIPNGFAEALANACGTGGEVSMAWDERKICAVIGSVTLVGKTIDGSYPDYRRIIPQGGDAIVLASDELAGAIKRIRIASDDKERKMRMTRGDGSLTLRIEGSSGFEGTDEVPCQCDADYESGINADFLVACVGNLEGDIRIMQDGPTKFYRIEAVNRDGFTGVIGPLRI